MARKWILALLAPALLAAGCNPPKYAGYRSVEGDYAASVPWGWRVMTDRQGDVFSQTSFIGPFDPDFFLGAPSLTVRRYRRFRPHRLRDGSLEVYADADDFVRQTLRDVYGPDAILLGADLKPAAAPATITLKASGLKARYFAVLSPAPAPASYRWGVSEGPVGGKAGVLRLHAYAVVPERDGFYVLCYPATQRGYGRYEDRFRALLGSFVPVSPGPRAGH